MGAIFCCFRVHDGHGNHTSNNTCSGKNVAPGQETISASSNIQDVAASNSLVVENSSSNVSRLANGEHLEDERSILLPPQHVIVDPRQETISASSNIQEGTGSNSDVVENYSSNESRLDSIEHSEDENSALLPQHTNVGPRHETISTSSNNHNGTSLNPELVENYSSNGSRLDGGEHSEDSRLLLRQYTNVASRQETVTTSSSNQDDASSSSEVVDNCSSHQSRLDNNGHSEDESSTLSVNLQAEIRSSSSKVELDPVLQILDQKTSESVQKDKTFTPCGSSSLKKLSQEVESGILYTFPIPFDEYDEDVCPTCFEEYHVENPKITSKCNHHFHLGCIYEWMERSETCPVCRELMLFDE